MTPEERRRTRRIAALERWAREPNRTAATAPARDGFTRKLEHQADPEQVLPPHERARRAEQLRQAHMERMAQAASRARRRRAREREGAADVAS